MVQTKRIELGDGRYVEVPVAVRPSAIPKPAWDQLSLLNDFIIDRVRYDRAEAGKPDHLARGTQSPEVTLKRGLGVCRDYAALFEHLARSKGFKVRSDISNRLNHAWNSVFLGGQWWLMDVTWNDGEYFSSGRAIPPVLKNDYDYRKRYFLLSAAREQELHRLDLISESHQVPDVKEVNYQRSAEARVLADRCRALLSEHNRALEPLRRLVAQLNRMVDDYNRLVARYNAHNSATVKRQLAQMEVRLHELRQQIDREEAKTDQKKAAYQASYREFQTLASRYPLTFTFTISER